jgi:hypothetical protein
LDVLIIRAKRINDTLAADEMSRKSFGWLAEGLAHHRQR